MKLERIDGKSSRYNENWIAEYDSNFQYHEMELGFWSKLDTDLYNWTYKFPFPIGTMFRILFSLLMMNHRNPVPISHNKEVAYLWWDKPQWQRYLLWRLRNPFEDLRKLYLGFGWAFYADKLWYLPIVDRDQLTIGLFAPYKIPVFPHFELKRGGWDLELGFKRRGLFSISFHR